MKAGCHSRPLCVIFHSIAFILFARGAWESQAERVAYSIATDRLNLIWVMPAQGRTATPMLKKSPSQECWHVLAPLFLLLWHVRERKKDRAYIKKKLAFSMR